MGVNGGVGAMGGTIGGGEVVLNYDSGQVSVRFWWSSGRLERGIVGDRVDRLCLGSE